MMSKLVYSMDTVPKSNSAMTDILFRPRIFFLTDCMQYAIFAQF
jgi:hypothetical protein